jgi:hypothetical protein
MRPTETHTVEINGAIAAEKIMYVGVMLVLQCTGETLANSSIIGHKIAQNYLVQRRDANSKQCSKQTEIKIYSGHFFFSRYTVATVCSFSFPFFFFTFFFFGHKETHGS